jgi:hypothetical protein
MNSHQRFLETMEYGIPDRVPLFEEGIREDVRDKWEQQGLPSGDELGREFTYDKRLEIAFNLEPRPMFKKWPISDDGLNEWHKRLDPDDPKRKPRNWPNKFVDSHQAGDIMMLRVHEGLFLTLGVYDWNRFHEVMFLLADEPGFIKKVMLLQGRFIAKIAEQVLSKVKVDAAIFGEPISGHDRSLVSPQMYEELVLPSYDPIKEVLKVNDVKTIIFRTYGNTRALLPSVVDWGVNCLWASESNMQMMDYRDIRSEYGRDLRLIGGLDLDALRFGQKAIKQEIDEKVPALLDDGGYIPLADGRVRKDIPFQSYKYYREYLQDIVSG